MSDRRSSAAVRPRRAQRAADDNRRSSGSRPDRVAAWAFVLGIFLILLAATTSHGDTGGAGVARRQGRRAGGRAPTRAAAGPARARQAARWAMTSDASADPARAAATAHADRDRHLRRCHRAAVRAFQRDAQPERRRRSSARETRPALVRADERPDGDLVRPGLVRQPHGLRRAPAAAARSAWRTRRCRAAPSVTFYHGGRFVTVAGDRPRARSGAASPGT